MIACCLCCLLQLAQLLIEAAAQGESSAAFMVHYDSMIRVSLVLIRVVALVAELV